MDKSTEAYIESMISPLISRIQSLETANQTLENQVRHLQHIINNQPSYQKPTCKSNSILVSASQHIRQNRISNSSRVSEKKPSWNKNSKFQSPSKPTNSQASHEKIKNKPPIPKIIKSPAKPSNQEINNINSEKKINGGTKFKNDNNQANQGYKIANQIAKKTEVIHQKYQKQLSKSDVFDQFQHLAKTNNMLLVQMKQSYKKQNQPLNYVSNAGSPKSQYNNSKTASPHCRSFISQSDNKKLMEANNKCGLATIQIN